MALASVIRPLSGGSGNYLPIEISGTAAAQGTTIHAGPSSTTVLDKLVVYAGNTTTNDIKLTIELAGAGNKFVEEVPAQTAEHQIFGDLYVGHHTASVSNLVGYAATSAILTITGHVVRITET